MEFFNLSWVLDDEKLVSRYDASWPERRKISYYPLKSKKQTVIKAVAAYEKLSDTNFPTLYATTSPYDDFADSFANYVHVVILKKPWSIEIKINKKVSKFEDCWSQPRCAWKKKILKELIN